MILEKNLYRRYSHFGSLLFGMKQSIHQIFLALFKGIPAATKKSPLFVEHGHLFYRNYPGLVKKEGDLLCRSCQECAKLCPTLCIEVNGKRGKTPEKFQINFLNCILCGVCAQVCPENAISMDGKAPIFQGSSSKAVGKVTFT